MSEEMLYDDVAMENARSLLVTANSKLKSAQSYYNSSKLTGASLVSEAQSFMDEIAPYIRSFNHATDKIYTGGKGSLNIQTTSQNKVNTNTQDITTESLVATLTLEEIDSYEKELQDSLELCDEIIRACQEEEDLLNSFLDTLYSPVTPEDYEKSLMSQLELTVRKYNDDGTLTEEYLAALEQVQETLQAYREMFGEAFEEFAGVSYSVFSERLNECRKMLSSAYSSKYALNQKMKEIPFLRLYATEEYQEFASQEHDLSDVQTMFIGYYYNEGNTVKSYLTEEQQMMFLFLMENEKKDTLGLEGYIEGLPSVFDYVSAIEDSINNMKGKREAEEILNKIKDENGNVDSTVLNNLIMAGEGFGDGINGFLDGIVNCIRTEAMMSDTQYKQMYLLTELENSADKLDSTVLNFSYQNASTIGNMTIPMLLSLTGAGSLVSSGLMGVSAAGNAKNQALIDGYSTNQAVLYGIFSGLSETVVGWALGKIPGLSKTSGFTLKNIFEEGLEEFSQEWFDAGLRTILLGEDLDLGEVTVDSLKSFAMGAIVAAELNGLSAISFRRNGNVYDIPFSEIEDICQNNPDLSPVDALMQIVETSADGTNTASTIAENIRGKISSIIEEKGLGRMDQHVLDILFQADTYILNENAKNIAVEVMESNKSILLNDLQLHKAPLEIYDLMYQKLNSPDTTVVSFNLISNLKNFFKVVKRWR